MAFCEGFTPGETRALVCKFFAHLVHQSSNKVSKNLNIAPLPPCACICQVSCDCMQSGTPYLIFYEGKRSHSPSVKDIPSKQAGNSIKIRNLTADTRREGVMRFHSRKLDEPASLVTGVLNQEGDVCCSLIFGFYEHREFK